MRHLKILISITLLLTFVISLYIGSHVIAQTPKSCQNGPASSVPGDPIFSCDCSSVTPFAFDNASTPDEIDPGSGITVFVTGGCPPYIWGEPGNGYSWASGTTTLGISNILMCVPDPGSG